VNKLEQNYDDSSILFCQGLSELVKGKYFAFDTAIEKEITILESDNTILIADNETGYHINWKKTGVYLTTYQSCERS